MKKTYINPAMEIVKIASRSQMMAGSPGLGGDYNGGSILSRRDDSDWEDEEDEEDF